VLAALHLAELLPAAQGGKHTSSLHWPESEQSTYNTAPTNSCSREQHKVRLLCRGMWLMPESARPCDQESEPRQLCLFLLDPTAAREATNRWLALEPTVLFSSQQTALVVAHQSHP
jgi:hypothetical protein